MLRSSPHLAALLLISLAACGGSQQQAPPAAPAPASRPALPPVVRPLLESSMRFHGDSLETLLWAAVLLDYESTASFSRWLGDEPRMARPGADGQSINASMPPAFFDRQDAMLAAAHELAAAAQRHDDAAMGAAFGRLAQSCIACHSEFLRDDRDAGPIRR
jgi:cytochrome c'